MHLISTRESYNEDGGEVLRRHRAEQGFLKHVTHSVLRFCTTLLFLGAFWPDDLFITGEWRCLASLG